MSAPSAEQRMDELETRLAFQEQALNELNDALTQARLEHARTHDMLNRVLDDLGQMRSQMLSLHPTSEPPPHY